MIFFFPSDSDWNFKYVEVSDCCLFNCIPILVACLSLIYLLFFNSQCLWTSCVLIFFFRWHSFWYGHLLAVRLNFVSPLNNIYNCLRTSEHLLRNFLSIHLPISRQVLNFFCSCIRLVGILSWEWMLNCETCFYMRHFCITTLSYLWWVGC